MQRHYELALTVRSGGRLISGSVVQRIWFKRRRGGINAPGSTARETIGEGLVLPLGPGQGVLVSTFRLLTASDDAPDHPSNPFPGYVASYTGWVALEPLADGLLSGGGEGLDGIGRWEAVAALPPRSDWVTLSPNDLPLIVRFVDPQDPGSAVWVSPVGRSPEIVSAAVRLTDAVLTDGPVEAALPWLAAREDSSSLQDETASTRQTAVSRILHPSDLKRRLRR
ncbi:MAG TPA: hypothetical protein VD906_16065 [Caulobacteraceae bacterium]|nr:hypothetical protein [Caulobacteraceae bacterium]